MKKLFLLFVFCCFAGAASAQYVEVVHLKNGGIIRGIIIEQIPNENLKIQTSDGNVFVYWFDEIEKITKETDSSRIFYRPSYFRQTRTPRYQASADVGRAFGVGFWQSERIEISCTHGCLVNPYFYVGAGVGVHFHYDADAVAIPIFADFRGNLTKKNVKPFLNFRIGYSVGDVKGVYLTPSVGMNINVFEFSVGYTYQSAQMYFYDYSHGWEGSANLGAVTIKVGIRF